MNGKVLMSGLAALLLAGCACLDGGRDAEGFAYFDGNLAASAPGEYFVLRYEYPPAVVATNTPAWMKGLPRWNFVEVRQLKDSVTVVDDGRLRTEKRRVAGVNWPKWLKPGARNVRVKFVGADYSLAADGREPAPAGFTSLFNGTDLSGWKGVTREENFNRPEVRRAAAPEKRREMQAKADALMRGHWHVRDGRLFFDGLEGGYSLATAKDYANFELVADWRLLRVFGDSGFYLRGMPQVQIWDPRTWGGLGSGGIYNNATAISNATSCEDRPVGDWNRCRMRLVGDRVSVWLNGVKVVDDVVYENNRDPKAGLPAREQIELQCHGDPIEFRNLFIRELP